MERAPKVLAAIRQRAKCYGVPGFWQAWGKFHDRFNVDMEPNEPNRFGWIVEIDPLDASSVPVKHTAFGRFCHEGAECVVNKDGRIVIYSGDDGRGEYVYRFVSDGKFDPDNRAANMTLLSKGTLSRASMQTERSRGWRSFSDRTSSRLSPASSRRPTS